MDGLPALKPSEIAPYLLVLEQLQQSGLLERFDGDITSRVSSLSDRVRTVAVHAYTEKSEELFNAPGVNRALPLLLMTDVLEKNAKLLDKRYPEPLLGYMAFLTHGILILILFPQAAGSCGIDHGNTDTSFLG